MLKKLTQKRNKKGFTLVELIVVIAILGILAAIAVPRLGGFRDTAALSADKATAASIGKAAELYAASNNINDGTVSKQNLIDDKLIEDGLVPQNSKGKGFNLKYGELKGKGETYYVTYDDKTMLYPEGAEAIK